MPRIRREKMKKQQNEGGKKNRMPTRQEYKDASFFGVKGVLGVSLIAGALFNIPEILKKPETDADWMMIVIIAAMLIGGAILLFFRFKEK